MVHIYNGTVFKHKKEWNSDRCYNMDDTCKHYTKLNKPDTKGQISYDYTYMSYIEKANL